MKSRTQDIIFITTEAGACRRLVLHKAAGSGLLQILEELKIKERLSTTCLRRSLTFLGLLARREPDNLEKLILVSHMEGRRSRGRAPTRWTDSILEAIGCNTQQAMHRAQDRVAWRQTISGAAFGGHDPQP
ncbi:hypothetical protein NE865_03432 [Phthorimaea operculella]|nr:hypothetical protein NE865_03432 [Phthorimaea operculella]